MWYLCLKIVPHVVLHNSMRVYIFSFYQVELSGMDMHKINIG